MDSVRMHYPNDEAVDLTVKKPDQSESRPEECQSVCSSSSGSSAQSSCLKRPRSPWSSSRKHLNIFQKHKLKYRYLLNHDRRNSKGHSSKQSQSCGDSGNFGSSSLTGSGNNSSLKGFSSTTSFQSSTSSGAAEPGKEGSCTSSSPVTSSSPSSGPSSSPQNVLEGEEQNKGHPFLVMTNAIPLVVMMQGQIGNNMNPESSYSSFQSTTLFRCNMCDMFSNLLNDVLCHVSTHHSSIHYCYVCNRFHNSKGDYERHKMMCKSQQQAFQHIIDDHYKKSDEKMTPLNLSVAGGVAMRAAQIMHNRKGKAAKIRKLFKCAYCKKAFFGKFYLKRHMRSHTGEKLCFCEVCGKGFSEYRNLRNHKARFHQNSDSTDNDGARSLTSSLPSESDQSKPHKTPPMHGKPQSSVTAAQNLVMSNLHPIPEQVPGPLVENNQPTKPANFSRSLSMPTPVGNGNKKGKQPTASLNWELSSQNSNQLSASQSSESLPSKETIAEESSKNPAANIQLGTTSSRLEITQDNSFLEESLIPITNPDGEKFFECRSCHKRFRTKFAMQRHLDFHADKRPFECGQCSYKAKTKPQLKVHLMRHTGEKGYHCDKCNYACVTHSDLNRHCKSRSHMFRVALDEHKRKASASSTTEPAPAPSTSTMASSTAIASPNIPEFTNHMPAHYHSAQQQQPDYHQ